ncbi:hypothetical protein Pyrfu_0902 [Pyrolobus fumarii 1A]|uniref:Helicase HerA central domain-containing protein n=1 Tax=Pyrolobus fumarii (strain DSM 11204 / 1A) TaxID=694429 RepID=G0EE77_PYRF1|nr:ATP-binding protein [Pyrolobus fumarii]AEM38771.1 hypothetical protein Pyrfu_0902 [Pyrolobus fumarii 1A]
MREKSETTSRVLGVVLSGATTKQAIAQLTEHGEKIVNEGMLVGIQLWGSERLAIARVEKLRIESDIFKPGDAWSELRRESLDALTMLESVSSPYVTAVLNIIGLAGEPGLPPLPRPPKPGDKVVELPRDPSLLFGIDENRPGVIWYGDIYGYQGLPVPLDVENITMHVGVFGETGSGKSYGVGYLLELLSQIPLGNGKTAALPMIVIDANGDYLDYHHVFVTRGSLGALHKVIRFVTPRSRLRSTPFTREIKISLDFFTPREAAEIIMMYKTGGLDINEMQVSALDRVISELTEEGYTITELLTNEINLVYERLEELSRGRDAPIHHQTARAIRSALDKFYREVYKQHGILSTEPTFTGELIDDITRNPSMLIVDFSADGAPGVPLQVKQLIVAYIARLLYEKFTRYKVDGDERYLLLIIEEAQNYAPNLRNYPIGMSIARDYLALIATQGRKFGISLLLVSQRPAFVDPVVLSMTNTWIIHRVAPDDVHYIARAVGGLPEDLEKRLTSLPRGVAVIAGQMNMIGHPVLVRVGKRKVSHRMGMTRVVETLRRLYSGRNGD